VPQTVSDTQDLTLSGVIVFGTKSRNHSYPHPLVTEYLCLLLMLCNLKLIFLLLVEMRTFFILQPQSFGFMGWTRMFLSMTESTVSILFLEFEYFAYCH